MCNRTLLKGVFAGALAVLGVTQAHAQLGSTLVADIPFEFAAGKTRLPAGEYTIESASAIAQPLISLRAADRSAAAYLLTNAAISVNIPEQSKLVFRKYGDQYFLAEIWLTGRTAGWQVPVSRSELELSNRAANYTVVAVLAKR